MSWTELTNERRASALPKNAAKIRLRHNHQAAQMTCGCFILLSGTLSPDQPLTCPTFSEHKQCLKHSSIWSYILLVLTQRIATLPSMCLRHNALGMHCMF